MWQCQGRNWDDNYVGSEGHKKILSSVGSHSLVGEMELLMKEREKTGNRREVGGGGMKKGLQKELYASLPVKTR